MAEDTIPKQRLELLIIIVIFSATAALLVPWKDLVKISDFFQYYAVSILMQTGHSNQIYNIASVLSIERILVPDSMHSYCPFLIPPVLSWIFYPFAGLKIDLALYIWTSILVSIVIVSYMILCISLRCIGIKKLWLAALIATSGPYIESIRLGQLSPILLLGLALLYSGIIQKKHLLALVGQCLFLLKPHLLLPILFFEFNTPLAIVAMLTCSLGFIGLLISSILEGPTIILSYIHLLTSDDIHANSVALLYSTLRGQLLKFSFDYTFSSKLALAVYALLLLFSLVIGKKTTKENRHINILFTSIIPLTLCFSLHLHTYDFLLLIPGIMLLSSYSLKGFDNKLRICVLSFTGIIFSLPVYLYLYYFYVLRGGLINPFFWATLILAISALTIEWRQFIEADKVVDNSSNY